jgi:EAL domain-containing protein (putative c-di-GMP-specific phosphodiesterase class I)
MRLKTVAEGVETAEQVAALRVLGCDLIQGYYFSRPLPQQDYENYLKEEQERLLSKAQERKKENVDK